MDTKAEAEATWLLAHSLWASSAHETPPDKTARINISLRKRWRSKRWRPTVEVLPLLTSAATSSPDVILRLAPNTSTNNPDRGVLIPHRSATIRHPLSRCPYRNSFTLLTANKLTVPAKQIKTNAAMLYAPWDYTGPGSRRQRTWYHLRERAGATWTFKETLLGPACSPLA